MRVKGEDGGIQLTYNLESYRMKEERHSDGGSGHDRLGPFLLGSALLQ